MVSEPHREVVRKAVSLKTLAIFHQSIADLNFKRVNFFKYINFQYIFQLLLKPNLKISFFFLKISSLSLKI